MGACRHLGLLSALFVLSATSLSHAQCTKDTDCKGDRVCEDGACVAPAPPAAAPAVAPAPVATTATAAPPAVAPAAAPAPAPTPTPAPPPAAPTYQQPYPSEPPPEYARPAKGKRHSPGMMAGGIVMVSISPIALLASLVASAQQSACEATDYYDFNGEPRSTGSGCDAYDKTIYGGLLVGIGLVGAGIPMIVIGGRREPVGEARLSPWASPQGGGLKLELAL